MPRLPGLSRLEALDLRGMKLGLAAIDEICRRLGRPERAVESVLVAGMTISVPSGSETMPVTSVVRK